MSYLNYTKTLSYPFRWNGDEKAYQTSLMVRSISKSHKKRKYALLDPPVWGAIFWYKFEKAFLEKIYVLDLHTLGTWGEVFPVQNFQNSLFSFSLSNVLQIDPKRPSIREEKMTISDRSFSRISNLITKTLFLINKFIVFIKDIFMSNKNYIYNKFV